MRQRIDFQENQSIVIGTGGLYGNLKYDWFTASTLHCVYSFCQDFNVSFPGIKE